MLWTKIIFSDNGEEDLIREGIRKKKKQKKMKSRCNALKKKGI